jgi:hypothetical protein
MSVPGLQLSLIKTGRDFGKAINILPKTRASL